MPAQHLNNLANIFHKAVEAVKPKNLLSAANKFNLVPKLLPNGHEVIEIKGKTIDITNKNCHVVGFGKAVLGMAVQMERCLGDRLQWGALSIPKGSLKQFQHHVDMQLKTNTCFEIFEGAENNQPDKEAESAASLILHKARHMHSNDILFVLISGGGSALLPLPPDPISVEDKMCLIKSLSNKGATIQEMNIVRIALSEIKGGKLAAAAANAHAIVSFVISDIVGDPVDLIASGPTCTGSKDSQWAKPSDILKKYNLWDELESHIRMFLQCEEWQTESKQQFTNNFIYIVGDNRIATKASLLEALSLKYHSFIASTTIQGEVPALAEMYTDFIKAIYHFADGLIQEHELKEKFPFDLEIFENFLRTFLMSRKAGKPFLLITAGEPTIKVTGKGIGGRNQELALRLSLEFYQNSSLHNVYFLSAGTDGIDGPCSSAGALGCSLVVADFLIDQKRTLDDLRYYIHNNDSYNFYHELENGKYHIVTGHTGTNVMDLHMILIL